MSTNLRAWQGVVSTLSWKNRG